MLRILLAIILLLATPNARAMRVSVGLVFNVSGQIDPYSPLVRTGVETGLSRLKEQGFEVSTVLYDSKDNAEGTVRAMEAALKGQHTLIIGEVRSNKALAAADLAESAKQVFITPMATAVEVTAGKRYAFRACFDDDFQGTELAQYAFDKLRARTVAIVWDGSQVYSAALRKRFVDRFVQLGGKIVQDLKIVDNVTPLDEVVGSAAAASPDVVFLPLYSILTAKFFNAAAHHPKVKSLRLIGGDGWASIKNFGDLTFSKEKIFEAYWPAHFGSGKLDPILARNLKMDRESDATAAAIGFDTAMLVGHLVKKAGSDASAARLADTLRSIDDFVGLTGRFLFKGSQTPAKSIFMQKVEKNRRIVLDEIKP
jgi:branched-chain amino acid transport system substrate-binding protein